MPPGVAGALFIAGAKIWLVNCCVPGVPGPKLGVRGPLVMGGAAALMGT